MNAQEADLWSGIKITTVGGRLLGRIEPLELKLKGAEVSDFLQVQLEAIAVLLGRRKPGLECTARCSHLRGTLGESSPLP